MVEPSARFWRDSRRYMYAMISARVPSFNALPLLYVSRRFGPCASCVESYQGDLSRFSAATEGSIVTAAVKLGPYYLGLAFKRIETFQHLLGMPSPDATPWELVEQVADSADAVYEPLKRLGAQQPLVYQDDTGAPLLSLLKAKQAAPPPERKGMYTTALRFEGEHAICVYLSGRRHAGENLDAILAHRPSELPPLQWMSDGLAANTPKQHQARTLDLSCLVHGRRQFVDIEDFFPNECQQVIDAIATIYRHEAYCQEHHFTPERRLAYHQAHSREVMEALKSWMAQPLGERCVEPNSRLGGAFDYLLKRWESLTRFLEIPGAPWTTTPPNGR
jgi:transposase